MKIVKLIKSPRKNKRLRVYLDDNRYFDFGLDTGETFIDNHDTKKKQNYHKRHLGNKTEKYLIENLIPSPALFSWSLLWQTPSLNDNVEILNKLFENKKSI